MSFSLHLAALCLVTWLPTYLPICYVAIPKNPSFRLGFCLHVCLIRNSALKFYMECVHVANGLLCIIIIMMPQPRYWGVFSHHKHCTLLCSSGGGGGGGGGDVLSYTLGSGGRRRGVRGEVAPQLFKWGGGECPSTFIQLPIRLNKNTAWVYQKASESTSEHLKSQTFFSRKQTLLEDSTTELRYVTSS